MYIIKGLYAHDRNSLFTDHSLEISSSNISVPDFDPCELSVSYFDIDFLSLSMTLTGIKKNH